MDFLDHGGRKASVCSIECGEQRSNVGLIHQGTESLNLLNARHSHQQCHEFLLHS